MAKKEVQLLENSRNLNQIVTKSPIDMDDAGRICCKAAPLRQARPPSKALTLTGAALASHSIRAPARVQSPDALVFEVPSGNDQFVMTAAQVLCGHVANDLPNSGIVVMRRLLLLSGSYLPWRLRRPIAKPTTPPTTPPVTNPSRKVVTILSPPSIAPSHGRCFCAAALP